MKITYQQLATAFPSIQKLARKELSVKEAVNLSRLAKKIQTEYDIFNQKQKEICEKYGTLDNEKQGVYNFTKENGKQFNKTMSELLACDFELDGEKVTIKSDITIETADVMALDLFVNFECCE